MKAIASRITPEIEERLATFVAWAAVLLIVVALLPSQLGGFFTYSVVAGNSMQPTLDPGDLAIAVVDDAYGVGDVVVFKVPEGQPGEGGHVIHRIIEVTGDGILVTQGDNKRGPDPWDLRQGDIVGRRMATLPGLGSLVASGALLALLLAMTAGAMAFQAVMTWERREGSVS